MVYYNIYNLENILYENQEGEIVAEQWRSIPECDGEYMVSDLGRVRSIQRQYAHPIKGIVYVEEKILRQRIIKSTGYCQVQISINRKKIKQVVHRLVGMAFIPNPEKKLQINHKDGVRNNNVLSNLEWNTASENGLHSYRELGRKPSLSYLGKIGHLHHASKKIYCPTLGIYFESARQAEKSLGVNQGSISKVCNGERLQAEGLVFNYV